MSIKLPSASTTKDGIIENAAQTIAGNKTLQGASGLVQFFVENTGAAAANDHAELKLRSTSATGGNVRLLFVPQNGQGWSIGLTADDILKFTRNAGGDLATNIFGQMSSLGAWTFGSATVGSGLAHVMQSAGQTLLDIKSQTGSASESRYFINNVLRAQMGTAGGSSQIVSGALTNEFVIRTESVDLLFNGDAGTTIHGRMSAAGVWTLGATNATAKNLIINGITQWNGGGTPSVQVGPWGGNQWGAISYKANFNDSNQTVTYATSGEAVCFIISNDNSVTNALRIKVAAQGTAGNTITFKTAIDITDAAAVTIGPPNNQFKLALSNPSTGGVASFGSNESVTLGNNGTMTFSPGTVGGSSSLLFVSRDSDGSQALFFVGFSSRVTLISASPGSTIVSGAPGANQLGVTYNNSIVTLTAGTATGSNTYHVINISHFA